MRLLKWFGLTALISMSAIYSPTAYAEVPLSKYTEFRNSVPQFTDYLVGVGRGIFWANVLLGIHGKPRLFCMPQKLALDEGIILSLIDQEIRSPSSGKPYANDASVEMVMVFAFVRRFPCNP